MITQEKKRLYWALRERGCSIRDAARTLKRGEDAVALALDLRDALGEDGAVAVLTGVLEAPYGAQRAAAVLRRWTDVPFPTRRTGGWDEVHAGLFGKLIRRALKAVPHVGDAPDGNMVVAGFGEFVAEAVDEARKAIRAGEIWLADRIYKPHLHSYVCIDTGSFVWGPVTLAIRRRLYGDGHPLTWVARADVRTTWGILRLGAEHLRRLGIEAAL